jgi:hypothetical protein
MNEDVMIIDRPESTSEKISVDGEFNENGAIIVLPVPVLQKLNTDTEFSQLCIIERAMPFIEFSTIDNELSEDVLILSPIEAVKELI